MFVSLRKQTSMFVSQIEHSSGGFLSHGERESRNGGSYVPHSRRSGGQTSCDTNLRRSVWPEIVPGFWNTEISGQPPGTGRPWGFVFAESAICRRDLAHAKKVKSTRFFCAYFIPSTVLNPFTRQHDLPSHLGCRGTFARDVWTWTCTRFPAHRQKCSMSVSDYFATRRFRQDDHNAQLQLFHTHVQNFPVF